MKILLDTNILVRAAITPDGLAARIVRSIRLRDHILVVSSWILTEVADVLSRPRIRTKWPLSDSDIQGYCQFLAAASEHATVVALPPVIDDPKDQAIIEAAVSARVDIICTADVHFEALSVREYLNEFGITVMTDRELLAALG